MKKMKSMSGKKFLKNLFLVLSVAIFVATFFSCKKKSKADNSIETILDRGIFVLGLDDSFPPLGFTNDQNEIVGYDIDLAKEVAERLNLEFRAQPIDWSAKEQELATGQIDCIWNGFTITSEREKVLAFTKPYLENDQILIVRADSGIEKLSDMAGKIIGLQAGSSAQDALDSRADFKESLKEVVPFRDNVTALNDLEIGGVDGVLMDSVVGAYIIQMDKKPFIIVPESLASESYGIAFRKEDEKLRDKVQQILEEMAQDGTIERISNKWFGLDISVIGK